MNANALRWDGAAGHYEVYYLSATDPGSGLGLWIRYTLHAPLQGPYECSLWFMAMDRDGLRLARKATHPIGELRAHDDPFHLTLAGADLSDRGMAGGFDDVAWELSWVPTLPAAEHVHPLLARARLAKTQLVLAHPDLAITGTVRIGDRTIALDGARGGQAHLWGTKHAQRWAWAHANDLRGPEGDRRPDTYLDAVTAEVPRLGAATPVVGRFGGEDFRATDPIRVVRTQSQFGLTSWRLDARVGARRVVAEVEAPRETLVGVAYRDPDGDPAYCYNSEVATMRVFVWHRTPGSGFTLRDTLTADGTAHFEYAQRTPVADVPVQVS